MANTEIPNNNPDKEPISDKSIKKEKTKEISRKNITPNKKVSSTNKQRELSVDDIYNKIFKDLIIKKDYLVKEIKDLEAKQLIHSGKIGKLRKVAVEYPQGWLTTNLESTKNKQASW